MHGFRQSILKHRHCFSKIFNQHTYTKLKPGVETKQKQIRSYLQKKKKKATLLFYIIINKKKFNKNFSIWEKQYRTRSTQTYPIGHWMRLL